MAIDVKICGLRTPETVAAAVAGGARWVGFVFFPASPRALPPGAAAALAAIVPAGVGRVGLVVDADDALLRSILDAVPLEMLQLHGNETPARVAEIRRHVRLPVMKAIAVSAADDLRRAAAYADVADRLLFDAQPPRGTDRPGGNAARFDWQLLRGFECRLPWLLAGGLDAGSLAAAVEASGARAVDVSSGVEDTPGVKSVERIRAFLQAAAAIDPPAATAPGGGRRAAADR
jgi:phosphoribosylanthranilate isomerase